MKKCEAKLRDQGQGSKADSVQFSGNEIKVNMISGGNSKRDPPVPIPNTEVKPLSADGTWLETARESRSSPDSNKASSMKVPLFFTL